MASHGRQVTEFGTLYLHKATEGNVGFEGARGKPLVLLFAWLGASEDGVRQYVHQYNQRNVDVLLIRSTVLDFLQPVLGMQLARKILEYLLFHQQQYGRFLVHAFSIGAYVFTLCSLLVHDKSEKYGSFTQRLEGIILDSVVFGSLENMAAGISKITSKNVVVRCLSFYLVTLYLKLPTSTSKFYSEAMQHIHSGPFDKPSLFFYCQNDPMSNSAGLERLVAKWKSKLQSVIISRFWERSVHTAHLKFHSTDYLETLDRFCRMLPDFFAETTGRSARKSKL